MRPIALALIRNDGKILMQKGSSIEGENIFYRPIGGGIEFGEMSEIAIRREINEELGATVVHSRLLTVIENIFEYNNAMIHEIVFLYDVTILEKEINHKEQITIIGKQDSYAEWISISGIKQRKVKVFPAEVTSFI